MGRRAKKSGDLGRSIQKAKSKTNKFKATTLHTTDIEDNRRNLQSVTEANDLDEFLNTAVLAGTDFVAEKQNVVVLDKNAYQVTVRAEPTEEEAAAQLLHTHKLTVPRRPKWTEETSPEQLDTMEREDFLKWRRALVEVEKNENLILTPFEKNLEVWRQLWRVVERSDVVVQIIDSRNPLLFRSKDLESYVKEVDPEKVNVLLLNKADLLSDYQRGEWAKYFNKNNINFIFFSARNEKIRLDSLKKETPLFSEFDSDDEEEEEDDEDNGEEENDQDENEGETEEKVENNEPKENDKEEKVDEKEEIKEEKEEKEEKEKEEIKEEKIEDEIANSIKILSGEELIENLLQYGGSVVGEGEKVTIGMVGYPNVGKSSTINVLCKQKKVAESATPGKTKHFQTIVLNESILLCDCPGLVFPSFVSTKADMVCNGLLPIDQMRDHIGPISILCQRIRRKDFKTKYGITLPRPGDHEDPTRPPTPWELLHSYGRMRGYMASHGSVDEPRSSRYLLKDYVSGKLLYCHPPQGITSAEFNTANVNVQYDDEPEEKPTSSNHPANKSDNFDSIKAGLEEMAIIETKVPIKLYQGKRKLKRKHHGEGQESVVAKVKGKTPSSSFTRVQRSYNNASN